MLRSYVTLAIRNLWRRGGYSAINIAGLGIGIAAVIVIGLYARYELTYDRFHQNSDRIFLVYKERITPAGTQVTRDTWMPLSERLQSEYPGVENGVRMWNDETWVGYGDLRFRETVTFTEPSLFEVFDFPLVSGDSSAALREPASAIISQAIAKKYFGAEDPIGRLIRIDNRMDYAVTGVLKDNPPNSSIRIDIAIPVRSVPWYEEVTNEWGGSWLSTFILLRAGTGPDELEAQFPALVRNLWDAEVAARTNIKLEALPNLYDAVHGNRRFVFILLGIAAIILLIAAINFTNLATVQSIERVREVGLRQVLGAGRMQLARQFMGESTVLSMLALIAATILAKAFLPLFNDLYGLDLTLRLADEPLMIAGLVLLGGVVGLGSGIYPALYVSRFRPAQALQGEVQMGGVRVRSALVVFQFALAIALISATLVMRHQLAFLRSAELQLDRENVVVVRVTLDDFEDGEAAAVRLETFKDELRRLPQTIAVSSASHAPGRWSGWFAFVQPEGWGDRDPLRMRRAYVDAHYFDAYDMPLTEGRAFAELRPTDRDESVIINQAALRAFGWTTAAGRTLDSGGVRYNIIGVVRDYHFASLHDEIAPVLHFYRSPESGIHNFVAVRMHAGRAGAALAGISAAWKHVDPGQDIPYEFVDDTFSQLYEREARLETVSGAFTVLAILIACLGLFGLASWSVAHRIREVGIRKVLGATVPQIVLLLSRDFLALVGIAILAAAPLAYIGADRWLNEFAYRIEIDPATFAVAGAAAAVIACATVSLHAMRAALMNPASTLKYE